MNIDELFMVYSWIFVFFYSLAIKDTNYWKTVEKLSVEEQVLNIVSVDDGEIGVRIGIAERQWC